MNRLIRGIVWRIWKQPYGMPFFLVMILFTAGCNNSPQEQLKNQALVLTDSVCTKALESLFNEPSSLVEYADNIILQMPDNFLVVGKEGIDQFRETLSKQMQIGIQLLDYQYEVDSNDVVIEGKLILKSKINQSNVTSSDTLYFHLGLEAVEQSHFISEAVFGASPVHEVNTPTYLKPSGRYGVGRTNYAFVRATKQDREYRVSCEVWYPGQIEADSTPINYLDNELLNHLSTFYEWPLFAMSYLRLYQTHSFAGIEPAQSEEKYPVIAYNHGYTGNNQAHTFLMEEIASHSFIVLSVAHDEESSFHLLPDSTLIKTDRRNTILSSREKESAKEKVEAAKDAVLTAKTVQERKEGYLALLEISPLHNESVQTWAQDAHEAISYLFTNQALRNLAGVADSTKIGAIGHSLGGAVAGEMTISDKNVLAGINLDGFQFGTLTQSRMDKPLLFVSPERSWVSLTGNSNDVFAAQSESDAFVAIIHGVEHSYFTDIPLIESPWDYVKRPYQPSLKKLVVNFFKRYLLDDNIDFQSIEFGDSIELKQLSRG